MTPEPFLDCFVLTGPTAVGKSEVGLILAERLGGEIISMDSMALYRGMDIGTAKPPAEARQRVRHHLIDVLEPWESANVAWWLRQAAECVREIRARGKEVLFVGGTPLYLKALMCGLFEGPGADPELRHELEQQSGAELHQQLKQVDPIAAQRIHPSDKRRLVRALEVWSLTGRPLSSWHHQFDSPWPRRYPPVWLDLPRADLYRRIEQRVEAMLAAGLEDEVRRLVHAGQHASPPLSRQARQALGYKELIAYLEGTCSRQEAIERIKIRSRNYAKHQLSWFRHLPGVVRLPVADTEPAEVVARRVYQVWFAEATQPSAS
ncbi:MAG: tRNA (adenosine(37)-N6)-dimethylallyltransferase MiaA [Gemmatales bacterium]|nr:tRNA (adenosine(37)-N6)-dimethylallyltransferase MiaA [Gemmatales bacterium]